MTRDYEIRFRLNANYSETNIISILKKGTIKNFIYFDYEIAKLYADAPIINAQGAARKVINALQQNTEGGPAVYVCLESSTYAHLWFYKTDENLLEFVVGVFSSPKMKEDSIDFAYYIRMFLDLCDDFALLEVRAKIHID